MRHTAWFTLFMVGSMLTGCPWDDADSPSDGSGGAGSGSTADAGPLPVDAAADSGDVGPGCKRGGCSGELCVAASAEDPISDCEFRPEYACYAAAPCEVQGDGLCGFTPSATLTECLAKALGDGGSAGGLSWYTTCGDPVCMVPDTDDPNVPNCDAQSAGAACAERDASCELLDCGMRLLCTDEDPKSGLGGCPISRARYKQGIAYLDASEQARIYEDLLTIPLATYKYKDDPHAVPQLGFVLEDVEPSPATRGDRVNLYGYLSMAVNAVQVQAKQIEALQRELDELRAHDGAMSCEP